MCISAIFREAWAEKARSKPADSLSCMPFTRPDSVDEPQAQVQISGKKQPQQIGQQQRPGPAVDMPEKQAADQRQPQQEQQPDKGCEPGPQPEEQTAPEKAEAQLNQIQAQGTEEKLLVLGLGLKKCL